MQQDALTEIVDEVACRCVLTRARLLSRVLTGLYDDALRRFGSSGPQFSLLVMIAKLAPVSRADIGRYSQLDRSTLTRNLQPLLAEKWIRETRGSDQRARPIVLTARGRRLLIDAAPAWRQAQAEAESMLGTQAVNALLRVGEGLMIVPARS